MSQTLEAAKAKAKANKPAGGSDDESEIRRRLEQQREESPAEVKEIGPGDVVDSAEALAMKRYKDLLDGKSVDKVASTLSKNIMANLVKEE